MHLGSGSGSGGNGYGNAGAGASVSRLIAAAESWRGVSAYVVDEEAPRAATRLMEAAVDVMETLCVADEIEAFAEEAGAKLRANARDTWDAGAGTTTGWLQRADDDDDEEEVVAAAKDVDAVLSELVRDVAAASIEEEVEKKKEEEEEEGVRVEEEEVEGSAETALGTAPSEAREKETENERETEAETDAETRAARVDWLLRAAATLRPHVGGDLERDLVGLRPSLLATAPRLAELKYRADNLRRLRDRLRRLHASTRAADDAAAAAQSKALSPRQLVRRVRHRVEDKSAAVVNAERQWMDAAEELATLESRVFELESRLGEGGGRGGGRAAVASAGELREALDALVRTEATADNGYTI